MLIKGKSSLRIEHLDLIIANREMPLKNESLIGLELYDSSDGENTRNSASIIRRESIRDGKCTLVENMQDNAVDHDRNEESVLNDIHEKNASSSNVDKGDWRSSASRARKLLGYESDITHTENEDVHKMEEQIPKAYMRLMESYHSDGNTAATTDSDDCESQDCSSISSESRIPLPDETPSKEMNVSFEVEWGISDDDDESLSDKGSYDDANGERHISFAYSSLRDSEDEHFNRAIKRLSKIFDGTLKHKARTRSSNQKRLVSVL